MPEVAERIGMSQRERDRLVIIRSVIDGARTQVAAAELMQVSPRQLRRLQRRFELDGDQAVVHKLRGEPSNNGTEPAVKQKVLALYRSDYGGDYGPTLLAEKLLEQHAIELSPETLRHWLLAAGLWQRQRKHDKHRRRRERRACFGELVQLDGSHHRWLEERGPQMVLLAFIDDATSRLVARFHPGETTAGYFDLMGRYVKLHGRPIALYSDRAGIFRTERSKRATEEEFCPQFTRALQELNVRLIMANSPQAKGRIERLFATLQDRWVKELREAKASTLEQANDVVDRKLLPQFNERFTVKAASSTDAHLPALALGELSAILCEHHDRIVANDYTVRFANQVLQIPPPPLAGLRGGKVMVERGLNGELKLRFKGKYLCFEPRPRAAPVGPTALPPPPADSST